MKLTNMIILSGILHNFIRAAFSCSPPEDWLPLDTKARVQKAEIVIYGTVRASPRHGPKDDIEGLYSALFEVHCILKGKMLPQFVNVSGFGFAGGLCTHTRAYLNKTYVALLRKDTSIGVKGSQFSVNEVNIDSATIPIKVSNPVLKKIMETVGENVSQPLGATKDSVPGCPKFATTKKNRCRHKSHRHKNRKNKKCRSFDNTSTQMAPTTTKLSTSRRYMSSTKVRKVGVHSTPTKRQSDMAEYAFRNMHSLACRTQRICWYLVLTLHGLVLAVIKWQQT
ncbi:uncharacterized protein [Montipora foliosa]|uniref:uncharacterized protein n=1 Tax=Montipora foliosa TaxID=591990 RepID=UPI0035F1A05B